MSPILYKFRLGTNEHITLRCERNAVGLRCRARAVIGSLQWTAEIDTTEVLIKEFLADIGKMVSSLSGVAELKPFGSGTFNLRVSVDVRGHIKTEYNAAGFGNGFNTGWQTQGSFLSEHKGFLKRLDESVTEI